MMFLKILLILTTCFLLSHSLEIKKECSGVIEGVLRCRSAIEKGALVPQVCGKCELEFRDGKLYIKTAKGCPKYDALLCELVSGEVFLINNLSCEPVRRTLK